MEKVLKKIAAKTRIWNMIVKRRVKMTRYSLSDVLALMFGEK